MTRVNVGINPYELCDQHLLSEYKELPRVFRQYKGKAPEQFTLGTGHVLWCAKRPIYMRHRYLTIVTELQHRGYTLKYLEPFNIEAKEEPYVTAEEWLRARELLQLRIQDRLSTMKRKPKWINRSRPAWTHDKELRREQ